ncbi:MAG: hypothetical protein ACP5SH_00280 [Syntrophobacteraceae bacterium]
MKTIVWDVDDVLNDLMRVWLEERTFSGNAQESAAYQELTRNPPHDILKISRSEYLASLDAFRLSEKALEMKPVPEVFDWFSRHGDHFHHMALTAAPLCASHASAWWVLRNFGRWIQSFHVVPSPRPLEPARPRFSGKSEFLAWWGMADILVDDDPANIAGALALGMDAVLVPRPWNDSSLTIGEALGPITKLASA